MHEELDFYGPGGQKPAKTSKKSKTKPPNKNKKSFKDFAIAGGSGFGLSQLIKPKTPGAGSGSGTGKRVPGGFRLGGLPGTAHNVGRRTNPQ